MLMLASLSQPLWGVAQKHAPRHCHWCLRTLTPWGLTPTKGSFLRPSVDVQKGLDSLTFQAASAALGCVMWAEPGDVGPEEDWMSQFLPLSPVSAKRWAITGRSPICLRALSLGFKCRNFYGSLLTILALNSVHLLFSAFRVPCRRDYGGLM